MALPFSPPLFERFENLFRSLPLLAQYQPEQLCTPTFLTFLLFAEAKLEMFYAPFDTVNRAARIVIVGITHGISADGDRLQDRTCSLAKGPSARSAVMPSYRSGR
jgi:hypothetical protein